MLLCAEVSKVTECERLAMHRADRIGEGERIANTKADTRSGANTFGSNERPR